MSKFIKATKEKRKLRLAIFGPSGAGKTYTALRLATGFGGSIAFIDTENSADLYADKFNYDLVNMKKLNLEPDIDNILMLMEEAKDYSNLIIDSFSHPWRELTEEVGKIAQSKYSGNTYAAWIYGTPKQTKLIEAILSYPNHLFVCMRSKTEWLITKDEKSGKNKPERIGLSPVQGKDIEFEFDMLMEINADHLATVIKDRTSKFQDKIYDKPDEKLGTEIVGWLQSGSDPVKPELTQKQFDAMKTFIENGQIDVVKKKLNEYQIKEKWLRELNTMIFEKETEKPLPEEENADTK